MEDLLYEVESVRRFAGLRLRVLPDETTILKPLLETQGLRAGVGQVSGSLTKKPLGRTGSVDPRPMLLLRRMIVVVAWYSAWTTNCRHRGRT